jgi:ribose 5-phosphate isomerase B
MKILISSDKAGFALKQGILKHLEFSTHEPTDLGPETDDHVVSFVDIAARLSKMIADGKADRGILICGTGMGMALTANKHKGVRAAVVESVFTARYCRLINDANVLCLGGFILGSTLAFAIVDAFLETEYLHEFEQWRVDFLNSQLEALKNIETDNFK